MCSIAMEEYCIMLSYYGYCLYWVHKVTYTLTSYTCCIYPEMDMPQKHGNECIVTQ